MVVEAVGMSAISAGIDPDRLLDIQSSTYPVLPPLAVVLRVHPASTRVLTVYSTVKPGTGSTVHVQYR